MKSLTVLSNLYQTLSLNTTTQNVAYGKQSINDNHRYLMQKYFFNEASHSILTIGDQQDYPLPYNYSKLKTGTITIGNLRWNPTEILTRREWDNLNVFPYYADIPSNFFIWNNSTFSLWPIPSTGSSNLTYSGLAGVLTQGDIVTQGTTVGKILSFSGTNMVVAVSSQTGFINGSFTTSGGATGTITNVAITIGNTITFNYKIRVPEMTLDDYTTGTVTVNNTTGTSLTVTGSGTSWLTTFSPTAGSVKNLNLWIQFISPKGDGNWYQIDTIDSATQLTLVNPYEGANASAVNYTIGQMPLLLEDFHDLIVYRALVIYYSSVNKDMEKKAEFERLYSDGIKLMDDYVGSKSLNVNLGRVQQIRNPNLYGQSFG